ncbi:phosphomethylpyrimidine synthase [Methanohalophilus sp.]|uniref:phosphomethylpyrimidine synthase n=1 Tax=Methanohalophilus sp. TaxID=1966352 RepID=UPI0026096BC9|nr:phosphomethylpyrimidine synthase [Methanohalophilus sp.]MDK2892213.1 phosphomethylpyrimidine synthase [Methanohalophilus sp.]
MTLMDEARKGNITPTIRKVAENEHIDPDTLRKYVAKGLVTIPQNVKRETRPMGIGKCMTVKINANVGTSRDFIDVDDEIKKAITAVKYGADTIMDLSTGGDLNDIRKRIMDAVDVPFGTVPIYQAASSKKTVVDMSSDDMFNTVRKHAESGVDFVTIHAGVNQNALQRLRKGDRIMNVVSRGGSFTIAWMIHNNQENPFYAEFDYLIELAKEYDLTLSLGDGMRPGCVHDASDNAKFMEFITLGELVKQSREAGVQTFVEGPGHVAADEIQLSVTSMKKLCHNAPLYLLGPLVTDIAPGYDHITGAIGGTIAGMCGADFLCMTTPAEHLALPTCEDVKEGAIVTKIAAHAADLTREGQRERARATDKEMAQARNALNWEKQFELAIDKEKPRKTRENRKTGSDACSMCGELCALKIVQQALSEEK